jgi:hypothetical protein
MQIVNLVNSQELAVEENFGSTQKTLEHRKAVHQKKNKEPETLTIVIWSLIKTPTTNSHQELHFQRYGGFHAAKRPGVPTYPGSSDKWS